MNVPATLALTPDGSATAVSARYGALYHNRNGALMQSRRVFVEGCEIGRRDQARVLEIGFGLGLNFLTTLGALPDGALLDYQAYEIDPQPVALLEAIGRAHPNRDLPLWKKLLAAWPGDPACCSLRVDHGAQHLTVVFADASTARLPSSWADAIYLDGFAPAVNPELWTDDFVGRLAASLANPGWLSTFSARGSVRRALVRAGLMVERCGGLTGKREWLRARRCTGSVRDQP